MKPKFDKHIFICTNDRGSDHPRGDCVRCGGLDIRMRFVHLINKNGLKDWFKFLNVLGYKYWDESNNQTYKLFLGTSN